MRKPILIISLLTALSVLAVAVFLIWSTELEGLIGKNTFQKTYSFLLVVVIGGSISLVYKEYERDRQSKQQDLILIREFYDAIIGVYNDAKRIRRLVRARALINLSNSQLKSTIYVSKYEYDEYMQQLNGIQLTIELMIHQMQGAPDLYGNDIGLKQSLSKMKNYLRKVLNEYEQSLRTFCVEDQRVPLAQLEILQQFIGTAVGDEYMDFMVGFVEPASHALNSIQKLIRSV